MAYRAYFGWRPAEELLAVATYAGRVLRIIGHVRERVVALAYLFPVGGRKLVAGGAGEPGVRRRAMREFRIIPRARLSEARLRLEPVDGRARKTEYENCDGFTCFVAHRLYGELSAIGVWSVNFDASIAASISGVICVIFRSPLSKTSQPKPIKGLIC
jgi:hypothetical protein